AFMQAALSSALSKAKRRRNLVPSRKASECSSAHQLRTRPCQLSFIRIRKATEQLFADHKIQERITEKFKTLVVRLARYLVSIAWVGDGRQKMGALDVYAKKSGDARCIIQFLNHGRPKLALFRVR